MELGEQPLIGTWQVESRPPLPPPSRPEGSQHRAEGREGIDDFLSVGRGKEHGGEGEGLRIAGEFGNYFYLWS